MTEDQADKLIDAVENISIEIESVTTTMSTDDFNNIAWIGEQLSELVNILKKIEAKL
jgi:hypothetical protein